MITFFSLDNKLKIYQKHLQCLAIEVYKSRNKLDPSFIWKTYVEKKYPVFTEKRGSPPSDIDANIQNMG